MITPGSDLKIQLGRLLMLNFVLVSTSVFFKLIEQTYKLVGALMLSLLQMSFPNKDSTTTFSQLTEVCKY